ncbi:chemotaxis protein CheW [Cohnella endophytica]|uniref:Chemotaxis protein CheW n=1 Tax=Cohnella endophytica TaxID=2419778 RepID=A0A494Y122_9BACL|nr:chemotaxis protein CheW [Cohnella endophytica]RKP54117.1 chemotaxis protein CheW [Cohnella endophytica]
MKVIVFALENKEYGIEVERVRTIERPMPITRVPNTSDFVKGVANMRGVIVPIISLRRMFGLEDTGMTSQTRIIVVAFNGMEVGIFVDSANDVMDIDPDDIYAPAELVGRVESKYLRGVTNIGNGRLLVMLDVEQLLKN